MTARVSQMARAVVVTRQSNASRDTGIFHPCALDTKACRTCETLPNRAPVGSAGVPCRPKKTPAQPRPPFGGLWDAQPYFALPNPAPLPAKFPIPNPPDELPDFHPQTVLRDWKTGKPYGSPTHRLACASLVQPAVA